MFSSIQNCLVYCNQTEKSSTVEHYRTSSFNGKRHGDGGQESSPPPATGHVVAAVNTAIQASAAIGYGEF
jgi:hypothetical protein